MCRSCTASNGTEWAGEVEGKFRTGTIDAKHAAECDDFGARITILLLVLLSWNTLLLCVATPRAALLQRLLVSCQAAKMLFTCTPRQTNQFSKDNCEIECAFFGVFMIFGALAFRAFNSMCLLFWQFFCTVSLAQ